MKKFKTAKEFFENVQIGDIVSHDDTKIAIVYKKIGLEKNRIRNCPTYLAKVLRLKTHLNKNWKDYYIIEDYIDRYEILTQ